MRNCFVPKCDNQCKDKPRRMMFLAPKDAEMFEKWKEILPKKREFKRIDKVCERHFTKDDIMTTFDHVINGELLQMERGRPRLKRNAVPSLHLDVDLTNLETLTGKRSYCGKNTARKSMKKENKLPADLKDTETVNSPSPKKSNTEFHIKQEKEEEERATTISDKDTTITMEITTDTCLEQFETLYDDVFEVTLPSMLWGVHREPDRQFIAFTCFDVNSMQSTKYVVLNNNGLLKIVCNGKVVSEQTFNGDINPEFISNILNEVEETRFCKRATKNKDCELFVADGSEYCPLCL